jgi:Fe2+ or Zn2+ uptake regulation protein
MTMYSQTHDCEEELRNMHLKVTPARLGVLSILESATIPLDVSAIQTYLSKNNITVDKVTVFRILHIFTEKGLTKSIQLHEGKFRYEYADNAKHHHFICENCGIIENIADCNIAELEKEIQQTKGLLIKRHSLEFFGLCPNCQK